MIETKPTFIARLMLFSIFLYAGLAKMKGMETLAHSIAILGWLPSELVNVTSFGLPFFEITCAIGLFIPISSVRKASVLGLMLILLLFTTVWLQAAITGKDLSCSCFGTDSFLSLEGKRSNIVRNIVLLAIAMTLYYQIANRMAAKPQTCSLLDVNASSTSDSPSTLG